MYVGSRNSEHGKMLKELFETPYFRCAVVEDQDTVEMCGALKVSTSLSQLPICE